MSDVTFDTYIDHILDGSFVWTTTSVEAAVFDKGAWTPDKGDVFLLDAQTAGATELVGGGYARTTLVSPTKSIDGTGHRGLLNGSVIDFGAIAGGQNFDTLVLFVIVTDDTDSWMLSAHDVGAQVTDGTALRFHANVDGFYQMTAP
jgi:hypothetical protein